MGLWSFYNHSQPKIGPVAPGAEFGAKKKEVASASRRVLVACGALKVASLPLLFGGASDS
jgi:hypothetical protein